MAKYQEIGSNIESLPMLNDEDSEDDEIDQQSFTPKSIKNSPNFQHNFVEQKRGKPYYKILLFWHIAFKTIAIVLYLGSSIFRLGYIATFILVVVFLSMDFWLTKNVSGRLLAGLRWWNHVDEQTGKMKWHYECWTPEERAVGRKSQGRKCYKVKTEQTQFTPWIILQQ